MRLRFCFLASGHAGIDQIESSKRFRRQRVLEKLVSVIVPVYNVEDYIEDCLRSIICQTYVALEVIVINDGSTDSSGVICETFAHADRRVRVYHQENKGLSNARNVGITKATGEYCYLCDSDDYLEKDAIEELVKFIASEDFDFVFFDASIVGNYGNSNYDPNYYVRSGSYLDSESVVVLRELLTNGEFRASVPLLFMRKTIFDNDKHRFREGIKYEDELFTTFLFLGSYRVGYLGRRLYNRRVRFGSLMTSPTSYFDYKSMYTVVSELLLNCDEIGAFSSERKKLCFDLAASHFDSLLSIYKCLGLQERNLARKSLRKIRHELMYYERIITGRSKLLTRLKYSVIGRIVLLIRRQ